jgi:hypothetical protein
MVGNGNPSTAAFKKKSKLRSSLFSNAPLRCTVQAEQILGFMLLRKWHISMLQR